jgi:hypothetical protein
MKHFFRDAKFWRRFHGTMTIVWMLLIIPSMLWWKNAIPWLVFMSVWANVGTHFGAWQGARAEDESATNPPQSEAQEAPSNSNS